MRSQKFKGMIISCTATMLASVIIVPAASAINPSDAVDRTVQLYAAQIDKSFSDSESNQSSQATDQEDLAAMNGGELYEDAHTGLKIDDAQVDTAIISRTPTADGYTVLVDITTHLHQVPENSNITITLGSNETDHLDTSSTYRHELKLVPNTDNLQEPYQVVSDTTLLDTDAQTMPVAYTQSNHATQSLYTKKPQSATQITPVNSFTTKAGLNWLKEVQYAQLWTDANHTYKNSDQDFMNPKYPEFSDNCTNFVSQALFEGGLATKKATVASRKNDDVWSYMGFAQIEPTYTWGAAENNYRYMKYYSGAFDEENNIKHIGPGGLIYADWNGDGTKDHAVIVTGNITYRDKNGNPIDSKPVVCQKTHNHHDEPMIFLEQYAQKNYPGKTKWYGLQVRF